MDIWKHGRYVDLWSVVHLLSGVVLALGGYGLGYGFWTALAISVGLLGAWEFFEWMIGIIEPSPNVIADMVVGAVGFFFGAYWHYGLGTEFDLMAFLAVLAATLALTFWGFLDFYFRGYR